MQFALPFVVPDIGEDNEKEVQMQDSTLITLLTASVALVSMLMSRFYLSVTSEKAQETVFAKLRASSFVLPVVAVISTLVMFLIVGHVSRAVGLTVFAVGAAALAMQFLMVVAVFFEKETRRKALTGSEAKTVMHILRISGILILFTFKFLRGMMRLSAKSGRRSNGSFGDGSPRPHGYHGYEGYVERSERVRGKMIP